MNRAIKLVSLYIFASLLCGCPPKAQITGKVMDQQGPVPGAHVLAMVWIEDGGKALPMPDAKALQGKERDLALEKDMKDRGLPVAYARAFADKDGRFTLGKLYFSPETKKAVKAFKQPRITRIPLKAFQKGYLKHALTTFPAGQDEDLDGATIMLSRPANWKELASDSYFRTLRRDEYDYGYSKAFGATKAEKEWFLEYTKSNLQEAYEASNIKGEKNWEEICGHDFSDVTITGANMQRNPARERCNKLLGDVETLRNWQEKWLDHSVAISQTNTPAMNAVKAAVDALGPEYAEVKANETEILSGAAEAEKDYERNSANNNYRNGVNSVPGTEEAQRLYNIGEKAKAYKALGYALYSRLPAEARYSTLTAEAAVRVLPGITDTVAGFYTLLTRPQTAQLPGGDDGNHKDSPAHKVESSTDTIKVKDYKSFQAYVAREEANQKVKPVTNETGGVRKVLKGKGIELSSSSIWAITPDNNRIVCQSQDNRGVSVIDTKMHRVEIYDARGKIMHIVAFPKAPDGRVAFSDKRLFLVRGGIRARSGFEIYDFSGRLVKSIDKEDVDGYAISHNQKYFAVTSGSSKTGDYFVLYDSDGNELWRQKIKVGGPSQIEFSPDDELVLVKMPVFWSSVEHKFLNTGKSFLLNIASKKLVLEEDYEK